MADDTGLGDYVREQLSALRGVTSGRFFSGVGFAFDGVQFGMIIGGTLYFVVDDTTRPKYVARGSRCFTYATTKRRIDSKRYFSVPADIIEDADELTMLARESIKIALIRHAAKPRPKPKKAKTSESPAKKRATKKQRPKAKK